MSLMPCGNAHNFQPLNMLHTGSLPDGGQQLAVSSELLVVINSANKNSDDIYSARI